MNLIVVITIVVAVVAVFGLWYLQRRQPRAELMSRFGPEYEQTLQTSASRGAADKDLAEREKCVSQLQLKDLDAPQRQRFTNAWKEAQVRYVDNPGGAIEEADTLLQELMAERGYPIGEFEQRATDVSVDDLAVVNNYRAAHAIADINAVEPASSESLGQAMVHYRALFEELLVPSEPALTSGMGDQRAPMF